MPGMTHARRRLFTALVLAASMVAISAYVVARKYDLAVRAAQERSLKDDLYLMRDAIDLHRADTGRCPDSLRTLEEGRYVRATPADPFTKSSKTWLYTQERMSGTLVCDVRSASRVRATDGRRYTDW
jgi:general secretion pathway protein G